MKNTLNPLDGALWFWHLSTTKNSQVKEVRNNIYNQLINIEELSGEGQFINKMANPVIKACLHAKK